ncbi:MAG: DNA polymerase clamp loader subunit A [Atribacterota bacterium]
MKDKTNIFSYLNAIFNKNRELKYDKKLAPGFLLSMWLSHDNELTSIVNKLNFVQFNIPDSAVYEYYMNKVPKKKRFIKWIKKKNMVEFEDELLSPLEKNRINCLLTTKKV